MPKILHIGGVDSPHVIGLMEQVKKYTNFEQSVISYPANIKSYHIDFLKDIPTYYYKYHLFFKNSKIPREVEHALGYFIKDVVEKEKPDIIHGHYLSKCCVPMYYAQFYSGKPGIVVPWSTWDITRGAFMNNRIRRCLDACSYVMCNNPEFNTSLLDFYQQPRSKHLFSGPPVRLYLYKDAIPDTSSPRIYVPRNYYQDVIFKAFPKILRSFPKTKITALSPVSTQELSKRLGIYNKINFLSYMPSQEEFAKIIQSNNIILSLAPDGGTGGTSMQVAYFGAVMIQNYVKWDGNFFKHNENVIKCKVTVADIENKLIYSIQNLPALCKKFKKNNRFLNAWDAEITGKNLIEAYNKLLGV